MFPGPEGQGRPYRPCYLRVPLRIESRPIIPPDYVKGKLRVGLLRKLLATSTKSFRGVVRVPGPAATYENASQPSALAALDLDRPIAEASAHADSGRFAESLSLIGSVLELTPGNPELLFARASALFAWGRFHEAH